MNILVVTPSFYPVRGGAEQVIYELTQKLGAVNNNYVVILTPMLKGSLKEEAFGENVFAIRFWTVRCRFLDVVSAQLNLLWTLPSIIRDYEIDVIHMFHLYQLGGVVVWVKKLLKVPLVLTLAGWDTYDPIRPVPKILYPYMAWIMNNSDVVTTCSRHMVRSAKEQGCTKKIELIPHGTSVFERNK